ncbi:MAG: ADP-ribosylglycohydrolase family protein, partial [Clostridium sp.]
FGTNNQYKGTWSEDTSMVLCTTQSLIQGLDYDDMARKISMCLNEGYLTSHGETFGVGSTTRNTLINYEKGLDVTSLGRSSDTDRGNGSLMRMLPIAFYLCTNDVDRYEIIKKTSSITHSHRIPIMACSIYSLFAINLIAGETMWNAYINVKEEIKGVYTSDEDKQDLKLFSRILDNNIIMYSQEEIKSSGYIVDTLESVFWCFLNGDGYEDCVIKAVNLGEDTDTIAALVGGLAGIYYGYEDIPQQWIKDISKREIIEDISNRFYDVLVNTN